MLTERINFRNNRIINLIISFFYSPYFALSAFLVGFLTFFFSIWQFGVIYFVLCGCLVFILLKDITPIMPLVFNACFIFRNFDFAKSTIFYIIVSPAVLCIIAHFILYPPKPFKMGKLFLPILIVCLALFSSGLFSSYIEDYPRSIGNNLLTGPAVLFVYILFSNYICPPKNFDVKFYYCMALLSGALLVCIEICYYFYHLNVLKDTLFTEADIGWGNINGAAMVLVLAVPIIFYLLKSAKVVFPYVLAFIFIYVCTYLSGCDGCLLFLTVFAPFMFGFTFLRMKNHKVKLKLLAQILTILLAVCVFLLFIRPEYIQKLIDYLTLHANFDNGRTKLYQEAWALFKRFPIFGAGLGYYNQALYPVGSSPLATYYVHSTLFQVLGMMGIVGVFAYTYYFIQRFKILVCKNTSFNIMAFFSYTMLTCYGFIDTCEFSLVPSLLFTTILLSLVEITNKQNAKPIGQLYQSLSNKL